MHYPDYSALWLSDVEDGRATALRDCLNTAAPEYIAPVTLDPRGASCRLGWRVALGHWDDKPLTWTVISIDHNEALLLCDTIVAAEQLYKGEIDPSAPGWWCETPSWLNTAIKKWLNLSFFSQAFDLVERGHIDPAFGNRSPLPDMVTVLSAQEAEAYVPAQLMPCMDTPWWLRDPSDRTRDAKPTYVDDQGAICAGGTAHAFRGIRPVITIRLWA